MVTVKYRQTMKVEIKWLFYQWNAVMFLECELYFRFRKF